MTSLWLSIVYMVYNDYDRDRSTRLSYLYILTPIFSVIEFSLNISLLTMFIYKIRNKDSMEGIENINDSYNYGSNLNDDYNIMNVEYSDDKRAIWNVMIKHCVLFAIAISSSQSFWVTTLFVTYDDSWSGNFGFSRRLIVRWTVRAIASSVNIILLWLVLRINNDKYICLCKCVHSCVLKNCMREDPNIIREGFADVNEMSNLFSNDERIEGHDLVVTNRDDIHDVQSDNAIVGHNVVLTAPYSE